MGNTRITTAALADGDTVAIDVTKRRLEVELSAADMEKRLRTVTPPQPRYTSGAMAKYARLVSSASQECATG